MFGLEEKRDNTKSKFIGLYFSYDAREREREIRFVTYGVRYVEERETERDKDEDRSGTDYREREIEE